MNKEKLNDVDGIADVIKELKKSIKELSSFTHQDNIEVNKRSQEIDALVNINNMRIAEYIKFRDTQPHTFERMEMALDIYNENFKINNLKFQLFQLFSTDLYQRIEKLGQHLETLSSVIESQCKKEK